LSTIGFEEIMNLETRVYIVVGGASLVSFVAGGASAYFITKAKYEKIVEEEIAEAKLFYSRLNKRGEFSDPTTLASEYEDVIEELGYSVETTFMESGELLTKNKYDKAHHISDDEESDFNYIEEVKYRTEDAPYVISHDEYFQGEKDYTQVTLTYFEEDDILCDEKDSPINDTDNTVGDDNLKKFGHGSKDNNIVYIRNDRVEIDFEVVRSKGNYAKDVLGFVEHSEQLGKPRRFRRDYE